MHRSASTPALVFSRSDKEELGKALNKQHRKFYSNDINDEYLVPLFQDWATANWCSENVEFFLEVASYKRSCSKSGPKIDIKKEADALFHKYISLGAPQEINISYVVRVHILRYIAEPTAKTFDEAQRHILELMEVDCFPRFFRSQEFLDRYRPVPDPLPPLKKTLSAGQAVQQQDTKSRSSSLKSYFRKVLPMTTTRTTRSQSSIDESLSETVEDLAHMSGDSSPRSAGNSPRSYRSRTMSRADEDGYSLPSVRSSEGQSQERDREKDVVDKRSNSFPMRLPGMFTLRSISQRLKNRRGSDTEYDENGSPTHSPRLGSPRIGHNAHSTPAHSPRNLSPNTTPRASLTPPHSPRTVTPRATTPRNESPRNTQSPNGASPSLESPRNNNSNATTTTTTIRVSGNVVIPKITLAPPLTLDAHTNTTPTELPSPHATPRTPHARDTKAQDEHTPVTPIPTTVHKKNEQINDIYDNENANSHKTVTVKFNDEITVHPVYLFDSPTTPIIAFTNDTLTNIISNSNNTNTNTNNTITDASLDINNSTTEISTKPITSPRDTVKEETSPPSPTPPPTLSIPPSPTTLSPSTPPSTPSSLTLSTLSTLSTPSSPTSEHQYPPSPSSPSFIPALISPRKGVVEKQKVSRASRMLNFFFHHPSSKSHQSSAASNRRAVLTRRHSSFHNNCSEDDFPKIGYRRVGPSCS